MSNSTVSDSRICLGVSVPVRTILYDEARRLQIRPSEYLRHVLMNHAAQLEQRDRPARVADEIVAAVGGPRAGR